MLYIPALGYLDIRVIYTRGVRIVKLVYPQVLYDNNICDIFLHKRELVAIIHELLYVVRAAHR